jgi:hypothetical protein
LSIACSTSDNARHEQYKIRLSVLLVMQVYSHMTLFGTQDSQLLMTEVKVDLSLCPGTALGQYFDLSSRQLYSSKKSPWRKDKNTKTLSVTKFEMLSKVKIKLS